MCVAVPSTSPVLPAFFLNRLGHILDGLAFYSEGCACKESASKCPPCYAPIESAMDSVGDPTWDKLQS
eukprot:1145627-Pelagomonas_calceolata.AAC.1